MMFNLLVKVSKVCIRIPNRKLIASLIWSKKHRLYSSYASNFSISAISFYAVATDSIGVASSLSTYASSFST